MKTPLRKKMPRKLRLGLAACALILLTLLALSGCRAGYMLHAAWGEAMLLAQSEPVAKAEKRGALDPAQIERTRQIKEIRIFAEQNLGITPTDNYSTIYLEPLTSPVYALSAAPKDELKLKTWWFPVVGNAPYLGFFNRKSAEQEKEKLAGEDYDVMLRSAAAYSTLGWFKDPITMNMLQWPLRTVAETIIHELTHVTLYVKGQSEFNEGFAQFVGMMGAIRFLRANVGDDDPQTLTAEHLVHDERIFSSFLDMTLFSLNAIYESPIGYDEKLSLRQDVYKNLMENYQSIKPQYKTNRFFNFDDEPVNNAMLLSYGLYHRNFCLFERVYDEQDKDLKKFVTFFVELSKTTDGDMLDATRNWLKSRENARPRPSGPQAAVRRGKSCQS